LADIRRGSINIKKELLRPLEFFQMVKRKISQIFHGQPLDIEIMTYGMPVQVYGDMRRFVYMVRKLVKNAVLRTSTIVNRKIKVNFYCSDGLSDWNK
jgi:hypothetical protein